MGMGQDLSDQAKENACRLNMVPKFKKGDIVSHRCPVSEGEDGSVNRFVVVAVSVWAASVLYHVAQMDVFRSTRLLVEMDEVELSAVGV